MDATVIDERRRGRECDNIDIASIAYHEAGHAVVALARGCVVHSVEIAPCTSARGNSGELCFERKGDTLLQAVDEAMICLAGAIAQARACPGSRRGNTVDLQLAHAAATYVSSNPRAFLQRLRFETQKLLDRRWHHVEVLAAELLVRKRLTGAEIGALFSL